jgi:hypothetical protein
LLIKLFFKNGSPSDFSFLKKFGAMMAVIIYILQDKYYILIEQGSSKYNFQKSDRKIVYCRLVKMSNLCERTNFVLLQDNMGIIYGIRV